MNKQETAWKLAKARMYKKPALAAYSWSEIRYSLDQIIEDSEAVRWMDEDELEELIGDGELASEFKMAFFDLSDKASGLQEQLYGLDFEDKDQGYNDCTVALLGNRFTVVGWDSYEEDYCGLTRFEEGVARTEAGKRMIRLTKAEMLSTIGQCMGILLAYYDIQSSYDDLHGVLEVIKGSQRQLMAEIKAIEAAYERAEATGFRGKDADAFDRLLWGLSERMWIE